MTVLVFIIVQGKVYNRMYTSKLAQALGVIFLISAFVGLPARTSYAATITVTSTADVGPNTLREAILEANATPDLDTIRFNIPGTGVHTIAPTSQLPLITAPVIIDGYSQPGAIPNTLETGNNAMLMIELRGDAAGPVPGLYVTAGNSTIRGLIINSYVGQGSAIKLETAGGNTVSGNFIGTDATGNNRATSYNGTGVRVLSSNNTIGGTSIEARNLISANLVGVGIENPGANNTVQGNYIGTNAAGVAAVPNLNSGITITFSPNNIIGGTTTGTGNVISGNGGSTSQGAIRIFGSSSNGNQIKGNLIGTDPTGTAAIGNGTDGIWIGQANSNVIGSAGTARNIISGNAGNGIKLTSMFSATVIQGNYIGTDITGSSDLGNGGSGVYAETNGSTIGGGGNTIAYNKGDGITVTTGARNGIRSNTIFGNGKLGIDLGADGVTPNDSNDNDTGANDLQNYPVLQSAAAGKGTTIVGTLTSTPNTSFHIHLFANDTCDESGYGEAKTYFGANNVTTDALGNTSFEHVTASNLVGKFITATTTNNVTSNTSEFSLCLEATAAGTIQFQSATYNANEQDTHATISVVRTSSVGLAGVTYVTSDGTAKNGADYTSTVGTATFADGETQTSFTVPIINDNTDEADEMMNVMLHTPTGSAILGAQKNATVTIVDNDAAPSIAIQDLTVRESQSGTDTASVIVRLSAPSEKIITVEYTTKDGTATAGTDYQARSGTLTFMPGNNVTSIAVPILNEQTIEPDETFTVQLINPTNATISDADGTVTITDASTPGGETLTIFLPLIRH